MHAHNVCEEGFVNYKTFLQRIVVIKFTLNIERTLSSRQAWGPTFRDRGSFTEFPVVCHSAKSFPDALKATSDLPFIPAQARSCLFFKTHFLSSGELSASLLGFQ